VIEAGIDDQIFAPGRQYGQFGDLVDADASIEFRRRGRAERPAFEPIEQKSVALRNQGFWLSFDSSGCPRSEIDPSIYNGWRSGAAQERSLSYDAKKHRNENDDVNGGGDQFAATGCASNQTFNLIGRPRGRRMKLRLGCGAGRDPE
jgi:hypothetical protein